MQEFYTKLGMNAQCCEIFNFETFSIQAMHQACLQTFGAALRSGAALRAIAPIAGAMPERRSRKLAGAISGAALRKLPER